MSDDHDRVDDGPRRGPGRPGRHRGLRQGSQPEKRQKQLEKVTAKLFKDFPPGSAKK